jgi:hypothetical protein
MMAKNTGSGGKLENHVLNLAGEIKTRDKEAPNMKATYGSTILSNVVKPP